MPCESANTWPYLRSNRPCLGIIVESPDGNKWPQTDFDHALIDTAYDGEIFLPGTLYNFLEFNKHESIREDLHVADSSKIECTKSHGFITIDGLEDKYEVNFHLDITGKRNTSSILIGNKFLKKFRIVLDGPNEKLTLCTHE